MSTDKCANCGVLLDEYCLDSLMGKRICNQCSDKFLEQVELGNCYIDGFEGPILSMRQKMVNGVTYYSFNRRPIPNKFFNELFEDLEAEYGNTESKTL